MVHTQSKILNLS